MVGVFFVKFLRFKSEVAIAVKFVLHTSEIFATAKVEVSIRKYPILTTILFV